MTNGGPSFTFTQSHPQQHEVFIVHPPKRPYWLHALLFLLTVLTTLIVGARLQQNFLTGQPTFIADESFFPVRWIWEQPSQLLTGIPFSATLLGILMAHEMGHFIFSVRNGVYATLPFFIPFPSPFGTMGAFIQIKSPFRSRAALFDIGIAGPIAGFLVAVPMAAIGLALSHPLPANLDPTSTHLGQPVIFEVLFWIVKQFGNGSLSQLPLTLVFLHPVALAAWVGMLATALNLIPGGQLDGGHLVYAIRPQAHLNVTRIMMILLVPLAIFFWSGWLIWVLALHLTRRHPPVPYWPDLDPKRRFWALVAVLIFIFTFIPQPVPNMGLIDTVRQLLHSQ